MTRPAPRKGQTKTAHAAKTAKTAKAAKAATTAGDAVAENTRDDARAAKRALRTEVRAAIRALSRYKLERKSRAVADFAVRAPAFGGRGLLLAYRALPDEACVDAAVSALAARGWRVAVPTVDAQGAMLLIELRTDTGKPDIFDASRWTLDAHAIPASNRRTRGASGRGSSTRCWCPAGHSIASETASGVAKVTTTRCSPRCGPMRVQRRWASDLRSRWPSPCLSTRTTGLWRGW
jgi:hypothetical protein